MEKAAAVAPPAFLAMSCQYIVNVDEAGADQLSQESLHSIRSKVGFHIFDTLALNKKVANRISKTSVTKKSILK